MHLIKKYFPELNNTQLEKFDLLEEIYRRLNKKVNLISRKDIDNLYERHILHSLSIAQFIFFKNGTSILDVGTGGGFPGIPLAIIFNNCRFHLVDSIRKKIEAVDVLINEINLKNVTTEKNRVENIRTRYDFAVSRSVTKIPTLIKWCEKNISTSHHNMIQNGIICLKGGEVSKEFIDKNCTYQTKDCSSYFKEAFFKTKKIVYIYFP